MNNLNETPKLSECKYTGCKCDPCECDPCECDPCECNPCECNPCNCNSVKQRSERVVYPDDIDSVDDIMQESKLLKFCRFAYDYSSYIGLFAAGVTTSYYMYYYVRG